MKMKHGFRKVDLTSLDSILRNTYLDKNFCNTRNKLKNHIDGVKIYTCTIALLLICGGINNKSSNI